MAQESYPKNQQRGAVLLALVAFGLAVDRFYAFYELQSCKGARHWSVDLLQDCDFLLGYESYEFFLSNIFMDLRSFLIAYHFSDFATKWGM